MLGGGRNNNITFQVAIVRSGKMLSKLGPGSTFSLQAVRRHEQTTRKRIDVKTAVLVLAAQRRLGEQIDAPIVYYVLLMRQFCARGRQSMTIKWPGWELLALNMIAPLDSKAAAGPTP